jgi:hypothetical protein
MHRRSIERVICRDGKYGRLAASQQPTPHGEPTHATTHETGAVGAAPLDLAA